jgi:pimeloyl-ACP methyl ester carboxylesterase
MPSSSPAPLVEEPVTARSRHPLRTAIVVFALVVLVLVLSSGLTFYLQPLWVNDRVIAWKLWRQHVESKYVDVDGFSIHYLEAHPPNVVARQIPEALLTDDDRETLLERDRMEGIPLVLVHGLGSRAEDWSPMIPTLAAKGFHVYALDLLGFGRSPQPDVDYSMELQEELVLKFMDALEIEHADVEGWSMGGWVALKLTLDHPDMVDRLVLFDAAGIYFPPDWDDSLFVPTDAAGLAKLTGILSPRQQQLPGFVTRAALRQLHRNGWVIQRSLASMENGRDLLDFHLQEIRKPTLVVWGAVDRLIPISVGEAMHRGIPNSSFLVVDGCGHLAPGECSPPILKSTIRWLKADPPPNGLEVTIDGTAH